MTAAFPGRVMYFPLADSVLLDGKFSAWLPPEGDPHAPKAEWIRVRKLDKVHLCPEGSARYAAAFLADMTQVFGLAPGDGGLVPGLVDRRTPTSTTRPGRARTTTRPAAKGAEVCAGGGPTTRSPRAGPGQPVEPKPMAPLIGALSRRPPRDPSNGASP